MKIGYKKQNFWFFLYFYNYLVAFFKNIIFSKYPHTLIIIIIVVVVIVIIIIIIIVIIIIAVVVVIIITKYIYFLHK